MDIAISEQEQKRAENLVWNGAGDYTFEADFRVYDDEGRADLYWNSVVGAIHHFFDWGALESFYNTFADSPHQELLESLFWIAFENAVYAEEARVRAAFADLRREYALRERRNLERFGVSENVDEEISRLYLKAHLCRILGIPDGLSSPRDRDILSGCELSSDLSTEEALARLTDIFKEYFDYGKAAKHHTGFPAIFHRRGKDGSSGKKNGQPIRHLAFGYGEHTSEYTEESFYRNLYGDEFTNHAIRDDETMMRYLGCYFGTSVYSLPELKKLRREYCTGNHANARIYITRGCEADTKGLTGPAIMYAIRKHGDAKAQAEKNRKAYEKREEFYREQIRELTGRIRNAMLMYLDDETIRASSGELDVKRVYRALYLDDERIFSRTYPADDGKVTVDLLLDSSESQAFRQETVAAQGYMIAEALSQCHIPVRIWSFRSVNGFTVLREYRDYNETDRNKELFEYFTTGANRDGLGIRVVSGLMRENRAEHRLLILLSDGRPNDAVKMHGAGGRMIDYTEDAADADTASEVHRAAIEGIQVMCVFTGDERNLDSIKKIYASNFAYIRRLEDFARSVGNMIQTSIRLL